MRETIGGLGFGFAFLAILSGAAVFIFLAAFLLTLSLIIKR